MADRRLLPNTQDPSLGRQEDLDHHPLLRLVPRVAYTLENARVFKVTKTGLAVRRTLLQYKQIEGPWTGQDYSLGTCT